MQHGERGLEALLRAWLDERFVEPLKAIAEEYGEKIGGSIAQRLAHEREAQGVRWYNIDMTRDEKRNAGILGEQENRPRSYGGVAFRVPTDVIREDAWIEKLTNSGPGTTVVICGYVHFATLVKKLRERGHGVDSRVYVDTVPEIKMVQPARRERNFLISHFGTAAAQRQS